MVIKLSSSFSQLFSSLYACGGSCLPVMWPCSDTLSADLHACWRWNKDFGRMWGVSDNVRDVGGEGPQSTPELPCHSLGAMLWRQLASRNELKMFFLVACFHFWSWQDYDGSGTFFGGKSLLRWMISPESSVNLWKFYCWTFWVELKKHFHFFFFLQLLVTLFLINQHFLCK